VKKLLAVLVLGSLTVIGCEKPASSKPRSAVVVPLEARDAAAAAQEKGRMEGKATADKIKAEHEKAKGGDPKPDDPSKDKPK
jgi:hypothetical protein